MQNFWVVTNAKYVNIVKQQQPGILAENILAEPAARNTAPCIAWACWSNLGYLASSHDKLVKDENNNCVVHVEDVMKVALHGLDAFIVSEKYGRILVCRRSEEQRIKEFSTK